MLKLLGHISAYSAGTALTTIAGLVSFPLFTRIFSVDEYGLMNLVSSALLLFVAMGKLGVQQAIVRFHGEAALDGRPLRPGQHVSTAFIGVAGMALAATALWIAASQLVPEHVWGDERVSSLLLLASVLVLIRACDSVLVNVLRAEERSLAYSTYMVIKRYGSIVAVLATVYFLVDGVFGFYAGTVAMELAALVGLLVYQRRRHPIVAAEFSAPLFRAMLAFGIPMAIYELCGTLLSVGDRFIIEHFRGPAALGLYSAAYNLCDYVQVIVIASIAQAVVPRYLKVWREEGEAATRRLVEQALHYYVMLAAAVVAGLAALGPELLVFLASEKYRAGAPVIPILAAAMVMAGGISLYAAGVYIHKQTAMLARAVAVAAVLGLALNVLLVPAMGIIGAALCSLLSNAVLAFLMLRAGRRHMAISVPWAHAAKFCVLAAVMYAVVSRISLDHEAATVVVRMAAGAALYAALVIAGDGRSRSLALRLLRPAAAP